MSEQRKKAGGGHRPGVLTAVLLMGLAVGLLVLLAAGFLSAALVVRGGMELSRLGWAGLIALFLAALVAGLFTARRLEGMPLVWGLCVGAELAVVILVSGWAAYGNLELGTAAARIAAALLGGAAAGILTALGKK